MAWGELRLRQLRIERAAREPAERERGRALSSAAADREGRDRWRALKRGNKWAWDTITNEEQERWAEHQAFENELASRKVKAIAHALNEFRDACRYEWTQELLASEFALGDGRRVTWRDATEADHEQRIALQTRNAGAALEDAAMHTAAIETIRAAGVETLGEAVAMGEV
jgi:hypothetical protein